MRMIITTVLILLSFHSFGQIRNGSFDEWEPANSIGDPYENPIGWQTNNFAFPGGFASRPVIKELTSDGFLARISSNSIGIDNTGPGFLSQKIATRDLKAISYESKCDSIFDLGACLVTIRVAEENIILYRDSVLENDSQFVFNTIDVPSEWATQYDSITLEFQAYGYFAPPVTFFQGYSVFSIDNVKAELISSTNEIKSSPLLSLGPNPVDDYLYLNVEKVSLGSKVQIYAMNGQLIYDEALTNEIEVGFLSAGVYAIKVSNGGERAVARFVKK